MIVFHEGLPGAGKSYEACLMHILPALKSGRVVVTNIEGINHAKFSEHTGIPEPVLKNMLITIDHPHDPDAQKIGILQKTVKDSLVVIDEIQNLFPPGRTRLPDEWNKYITEHRHEGLDIILMGQDRRDLHAIWRRRIQRLIVFTNQGPVGRPGHYKWEAFEAQTPEKYQKISSGSREYEKKYFGLYSSYTEGTEHKKVYADKRVSIFKGKGFTLGIPIFIVVFAWAVMFLLEFFGVTGKPEASTPVAVETKKVSPVMVSAERQDPVGPVYRAGTFSTSESVDPVEVVPEPIDSFDRAVQQYRPRLSGLVTGSFGGKEKLLATIQLLDATYHVKDEYSLSELSDMGWMATLRPSGLELEKQGVRHLIRQWPVDSWGKVNSGTRESLRSAPSVASAGARDSQRSAQVIFLDDSTADRSSFSDPRSYSTGAARR